MDTKDCQQEQPSLPPDIPATPRGISRRTFLAGGAALGAGGILAALSTTARSALASSHPPGIQGMKIVCIIRYEIDPYQRDAFKTYAENWGPVIPRCGGYLIGYFLPWTGTDNVGWGLIALDGLADYEVYEARLRRDPDGIKNFAYAQTKRFILKAERNFVEVVDGTFNIPAAKA